jgi:hypothetical protein
VSSSEILCDLVLSKAKNSPDWEAEIAAYPPGWRRDAGNPGISWKKASDRVGHNSDPDALYGLLPGAYETARIMVKAAFHLSP